MNHKLVRLGWLVLLPGLAIVLGILLLQGQETITVAQGPVAQAVTWPPMHRYLSTGTRSAKVRDLDGSSSGLLVTWTEGQAPQINGALWMGWHNKSAWSIVRVDDQGGYLANNGTAAVFGTTAHFVWVANVQGLSQYRIFYRTRNLTTGAWSATEKVYPPSSSPDTAYRLQDVQIAVDAGGVPHVVWAQNAPILLGQYRDRIYYSQRVGGAWSPAAKISGYIGGDNNSYSEDMPAIVTLGSDVYVAWREKGQGDTFYGIYFRHRKPADGTWEPQGDPLGKRLSTNRYDEFPSMAAVGSRVYVMWDRWLRAECNAQSTNCYQVYSMTHRALTGPDVINNWWPADGSRDMLTGDDQPIVAYSVMRESGSDPLGAPLPDDYYSGVRPSIQVSKVGAVYQPCVVWHHWANEGNKSAAVNDAAPYQVRYSCVEEGDLETARWDDTFRYQTVQVLNSDRFFAAPLLALTPSTTGGYDLHMALNAKQGTADQTWGTAYTNLDEYYVSLLPRVFRSFQ